MSNFPQIPKNHPHYRRHARDLGIKVSETYVRIRKPKKHEPIFKMSHRRPRITHLMSAPPLSMNLDTFRLTHWSQAAGEDPNTPNSSLGIPTITSMPLPMSARRMSGSASKSFTFPTLFSFRRSTTTGGGSLWEDRVPQLIPIAESTKRRDLWSKKHKTSAFTRLGAAISSSDRILIEISNVSSGFGAHSVDLAVGVCGRERETRGQRIRREGTVK